MFISSHLSSIFEKDAFRDKVIESIYNAVKKVDADHVVVTGSSGLIAAVLLNEKYGVPFVFVRKQRSAHSAYKVEGFDLSYKKGVILDDLIASGDTVFRVLSEYKSHMDLLTERSERDVSVKICNFIICYESQYFGRINGISNKVNRIFYELGSNDLPKEDSDLWSKILDYIDVKKELIFT